MHGLNREEISSGELILKRPTVDPLLQFSKYQGLGNDFLILDGRSGDLAPSLSDPEAEWVRRICDRRFGVGGDGLILSLIHI